ncbi:MAG: TetR family transcriptional regulator [Myxococcota bacterium]|nr:TetR family transcriptional regulator [Myxococcota bacterium]
MAKVTAEEAAKTRERLLDAALEVFSEQGVSRPSLTRVAERVGMTRGAIYGHFENKNDLFRALCDRYLSSDAALADYRAAVSKDPLGGLLRWLQLVIDRAQDDPERRMLIELLFMKSEAIEGDGIRDRLQSDSQRGVDHQRALIQMAVEAGQLPPDLDVQAAAWATNAYIVGMLRCLRLHPELVRSGVSHSVGPVIQQLLDGPALTGT